MEKLYLLDAYALIYRAYYAMINSPRMNSKGENTSAVFGFVNTLEDLLRHHQPDYLAVAFDPAGPTFRHEAYPEYKAQREATPRTYATQCRSSKTSYALTESPFSKRPATKPMT